VVREAGCSDKGVVTEWTVHGCALVKPGLAVLVKVVRVLEISVAVGAVQVIVVSGVRLMLISFVGRMPRLRTCFAFVGFVMVILDTHVFFASFLVHEA